MSNLNDGDEVDQTDVSKKSKYYVNDKVFALEKGMVYEAIIRKTALRTVPVNNIYDTTLSSNDNWEYYVHFQGWNSRYDRWLKDEEIKPYNEEWEMIAQESKLKLKAAMTTHKKKKEIKAREKQNGKDKTGQKQSQTKRKRNMHKSEYDIGEQDVEKISTGGPCHNELDGTNRYQVDDDMDNITSKCCHIPFTLQIILIQDRNKITQFGRFVSHGYDHPSYSSPVSRVVHSLPSSVSIDVILNNFLKRTLSFEFNCNEDMHVLERDKVSILAGSSLSCGINGQKHREEQRYREMKKEYRRFGNDIMSLFEVMLPKYLLYKEERNQYLQLVSESPLNSNTKLPLSKIYAGEFLLRMLVRLPMIFSSLETTSISQNDTYNNISTNMLQRFHQSYHQDHRTHEMISELILFLQKNSSACFKSNYRKPTYEEYDEIERAITKKMKKS